MLSKEKTRKAFSRAAPKYDQYATWQQKIAKILVDEIKFIPDSVLDLGCGTGEMAFLIKNKFSQAEIHGIDMAEGMIEQAEKRSIQENKPDIIFKIGDMEKIDYPEESFDLIVSNLSLQWLNELDTCFREVKRLLKPEGRFFFSTVLQGSQQELTNAYKKTFGKFSHQHIFISRQELERILHKQKLKLIEKKEIKEIISYNNFKELVIAIKRIGAKAQNPKFISREDWYKLEKNYPKNNNLLSLTYFIFVGCCQKIV